MTNVCLSGDKSHPLSACTYRERPLRVHKRPCVSGVSWGRYKARWFLCAVMASFQLTSATTMPRRAYPETFEFIEIRNGLLLLLLLPDPIVCRSSKLPLFSAPGSRTRGRPELEGARYYGYRGNPERGISGTAAGPTDPEWGIPLRCRELTNSRLPLGRRIPRLRSFVYTTCKREREADFYFGR